MSPFKIISNEILHDVMQYKGNYPYVDGLIFSVTNNIGQISAKHHERYKGKSNYTLIRSAAVFMKLATGFSVTPLRIASYTGILISFGGFVLAIFYIMEYFIIQHEVEGWTTIVVIQLIKGGLTLFCIGVVGEYLGRAFLIINTHPQYSIKETVTSGEIKKQEKDFPK